MVPVTEFAAASGRKLSEITALRWDALNRKDRTISNGGPPFKLIGKAWEIVIAQEERAPEIFPYNPHSVSAKFVAATNALGLDDLQFNDLRLEAICRLLTLGFDLHEVAEITGQKNLTIINRIRATFIDRPPPMAS